MRNEDTPNGVTEIPFEFPLKPKPGQSLYETYHGVFVNIQYNLKADMKRSMLNKDLSKTLEFLVENKPDTEKRTDVRVDFNISPDTLDNVRQKDRVSPFKISGSLNTATCSIVKPFLGQFVVESSTIDIKSIELQLLRVETCGCAEGYAKDATEIQNIQIADGDVCRGQAIPVHMIFPRLFTCPTLATKNFKIEFEVNIVVVFQDGHLVTENFPIKLIRDA
ncbi:down syndrome critical region protein 3 [Capsaspora owczarzaki ATCC 30864]|uniref:Down syndrome critical region protein 3 n=1 Tax=Capsaspora owczarzaki (strain ATCC 30864) TaxID=595528 RepID=A0A0D2X3Z3_CAPO3|nr:down syndrome critical region protein 3 [Capsaspora owczarzaki ATCC 30864]